MLCFSGVMPFGVMVRPRKSTSFVPNWHFAIEGFNPAFWRHLKTSRKLMVGGSGEVAAMPMVSTFCAFWSALIAGSKYSRIKSERLTVICRVLGLVFSKRMFC